VPEPEWGSLGKGSRDKGGIGLRPSSTASAITCSSGKEGGGIKGRGGTLYATAASNWEGLWAPMIMASTLSSLPKKKMKSFVAGKDNLSPVQKSPPGRERLPDLNGQLSGELSIRFARRDLRLSLAGRGGTLLYGDLGVGGAKANATDRDWSMEKKSPKDEKRGITHDLL